MRLRFRHTFRLRRWCGDSVRGLGLIRGIIVGWFVGFRPGSADTHSITSEFIYEVGSGGWIRTNDQRINSPGADASAHRRSCPHHYF